MLTGLCLPGDGREKAHSIQGGRQQWAGGATCSIFWVTLLGGYAGHRLPSLSLPWWPSCPTWAPGCARDPGWASLCGRPGRGQRAGSRGPQCLAPRPACLPPSVGPSLCVPSPPAGPTLPSCPVEAQPPPPSPSSLPLRGSSWCIFPPTGRRQIPGQKGALTRQPRRNQACSQASEDAGGPGHAGRGFSQRQSLACTASGQPRPPGPVSPGLLRLSHEDLTRPSPPSPTVSGAWPQAVLIPVPSTLPLGPRLAAGAQPRSAKMPGPS